MNRYLKDILKLSWPIIIGQLGMVFIGFFDTLMVGQLGTDELAAAGVSNSIFFLVAIFPMGVTMAFATIVGILQGQKKNERYTELARDSFNMTVVLSVLACLIIVYIIYHFSVFDQTPEVEALAIPYLELLMWSLTPMMVFFFAKNISDGFSYTQAGMLVTLSTLLLNVFLNWVLIFGKLGFDAYGLQGAGYATVISRIYLAVAMLVFMFKSSRIPVSLISFVKSFTKSTRETFYRQIAEIGFPTGLQYFFEIGAFAVAAIMAGWLGARELAAHNLAITLASVTYMFASGVSAGSSICVAKAYGAEDYKSVRQFGINGHILGLSIMGLFGVLFYFFNYELAALFSNKEDVIFLGSQLLILTAIFQLSDGLSAVSIGLLRGVSDVKIPSFFTFVAYWIIGLPIGYWMSHSLTLPSYLQGVEGIWIGLTVGLTLVAVILSYRFYYLLRRR